MVHDDSFGSTILDIFIHIVMIFVLVVTLYPILHVASVSMSAPWAVSQNVVTFYPKGINFEAYSIILKAGKVTNGLKNSVIYTVIGTIINMLLTITVAYPLSKKRLPFRSGFLIMIMITMFFYGGLIPTFLLVNDLGMYNTIWAMVIPGAVSTYNMIVMRSFFQNIPVEMEESAYLDGANDFTILFYIVLPLSKAAIATISLFYAVTHWNNFFSALIFLKSSDKYPLQLILREIVLANSMAEELASTTGIDEIALIKTESIKYATLFISLLPMLILYPFVQKHFVKGVMIGSLKG